MTDTIDVTSTCDSCTAVSGRCYTCRKWHCQHLLKRLAGRWFCVACWGRETAS